MRASTAISLRRSACLYSAKFALAGTNATCQPPRLEIRHRLFAQLSDLQHSRQIRAPRTACISHVAGKLLRTLGCQFIEPIDHLGITAALLNETTQPVSAIAPALGTALAQHIDR